MLNKRGDIKLRALSISTACLMLATGFRLLCFHQQKKYLLNEKATLEEEYDDLVLKYDEINNVLTQNDTTYDVESVQEIGGRVVYFVTNQEEAPVEEITPPMYIDNNSDENVMAEDGWLHDGVERLDLTFDTTNEMIAFYSKVFQVNDEMIANKIYEMINNNPIDFENNILNGIEYETEEQAIARTIADIALFPENYNLDDGIYVEEYELDGYIPEELIYKFSEVIGVNPNIALAVAYGESGTSLDSYNFTHNYNVAGLHLRENDPSPTTSEGYVIYKNPADGLFRFILVLHDNFYVTLDSDRSKINSMASTYCEIPDYWRSLVGGIYYNLETNGYDYYYINYNYQDRDLIYPQENNQLVK